MNKWITTVVASAALAAPMMMQTALAQTVIPEPGARLVTVDVTVRNGVEPVNGLTQADFTVKDKGKVRDIAFFQFRDTETMVPDKIEVPPGVVSNVLDNQGLRTQSATVILYDKINTFAADQAFIRQQLLGLLSKLKPDQRIGFYYLDFELHLVHDFKSDVLSLIKVAQRLQQEKPTPDGLDDRDLALYSRLFEALQPMQELNQQARVNITYPAFRVLARHLGGFPGGRNLMWITAQYPLTFGNSTDRRQLDEAELQRFTNYLTGYDIRLFPVDPRGNGESLNTPTALSNEGQLLVQQGTALIRNNQASSLTGWQSMLLLAKRTGGKTYRNTNDIEPVLREVVESSQNSYRIGFWVPASALDGSVHDIKVEVRKTERTQNSQVSYREEYVAYKPGTDTAELPSLEELMSDPLGATGLGLLAAAASSPQKPDNYKIDVRVDVRDLTFEKSAGKFSTLLKIGMGVEGTEGGLLQDFPVSLTQDQYNQAAKGGGVSLTTYISTLAQGGRLRVVAQDTKTGKAGSISIRLP